MKSSLPANFLWGNSVSSMQTEGAWNEGGKGMSVYDIREPKEFASDWKVATDSYHRFEEDFDLMKDLGMNCYRFQIAWSRVCPTGDGEFNEEGIAFYERFITGLIERGIEPMICLYHFDMPLALAEKLGVRPEECLYLGDTNTDMDTGRSAGMHPIGVLWGFRDRAELEAHGAEFLIECPEEVEDCLAFLESKTEM